MAGASSTGVSTTAPKPEDRPPGGRPSPSPDRRAAIVHTPIASPAVPGSDRDGSPGCGVASTPATRGAKPADAALSTGLPHGRGTGYVVLSHLLAGMVAYGAIGWLIGRALHTTAAFPAGMLVGLGISVALVIHRYGRRSAPPTSARPTTRPGCAPNEGLAAGATTRKERNR